MEGSPSVRALTAVLAYCGLRPGEAYGLRVEDIDLERGFVFVRGNGARSLKTDSSEAPVPMPDALIPIIRTWLPLCRSEWLFPGSSRRGPWARGSYRNRPWAMLRQAAAEAGVPGMTPRSLRHSLATHLAGWWGLSSRQVRLVLRHTTEFTQAYYVHPDLANLRESMAGFDYQAASSPLPSPTTPRIAG